MRERQVGFGVDIGGCARGRDHSGGGRDTCGAGEER